MQILAGKCLYHKFLIKRNIRLNSVIRKINDELQELFKKYNFYYISNDEMGRSFLCIHTKSGNEQ